MSSGNSALIVRGAGGRSRARDRGAEVSELVERESGRLLNYFLRRTSNHEDAADLLGETLVIVWRRERSIPDDETRSRMWMYGIARKVLAGQHRSDRRRTALRQRLAEELLVSQPDQEDDEMVVVVRRAVSQLDVIDQEIIRLHYWDGFSLVEAAAHLGLRPATVRSRHARIRSKLRIKLEPGLEH